jgi:hypothetical protein
VTISTVTILQGAGCHNCHTARRVFLAEIYLKTILSTPLKLFFENNFFWSLINFEKISLAAHPHLNFLLIDTIFYPL